MESDEAEICTLGKWESSQQRRVACKAAVMEKDTISKENLRLIRIRSGCKKTKKSICTNHFEKYVTVYAAHHKRCCDALNLHEGKKMKAKGTVEISLENREKGKSLGLLLIPGKKFCISCNKAFYKQLKGNAESALVQGSSPSLPSSQPLSSGTPGSAFVSPGVPTATDSPPVVYANLDLLNQWLVLHGEEPADIAKLRKQHNYSLDQLDKVKRILELCKGEPEDSPFLDSDPVSLWKSKSELFDEIIGQLQEYFKTCKKTGEKIQVLSVLPESWSDRQIKGHFTVSRRLIRKSRALVEEKGLFCTPDKKAGKALDEKTVETVNQFYYRQDVSKEMSGKADFISVKGDDGKRIKKNKRLLLGNLKTLHEEYSKLFPDQPVSFAKFARLRPRECVFASSSGAHKVCVCTIHENVDLMLEAADIKSICGVDSAVECSKMLVCNEPTDNCYLRKCVECPDSSNLRELLEVALDTEMTDSVTFNQWECTDRGNIITKTESVDVFIDEFIEKLEVLLPHHFIFKKQTAYFNFLQSNLEQNEVILVADFSENYSFIVQNSSQAFYFGSNKKQATLHPFSCYYRDPVTNKTEQKSFSVVSDCMEHSTAAVHAFLKKLLGILKEMFPGLVKVHYFSDGCAAQYKNKNNVANVWFHFSDFELDAEWNYFATSHGKSACDGIGGAIKRQAALFSIRNTQPGIQITSAKRLFEWAVTNMPGVKFIWVSEKDVSEAKSELDMRFNTSNEVEGIRKAHCVIPCKNENFVLIKPFSQSVDVEKREIATAEIPLKFADIKGFVTVKVENDASWNLAYVESKNPVEGVFQVQMLQKLSGKKYDYEFTDHHVSCTIENVLTICQPIFRKKGKVVKILASDDSTANTVLKNKM